MRKRVVTSVYWPQDFGWRVGDDYKAPVARASQVVQHEQEKLGNDLHVPEFLLTEMDRVGMRPRDLLWVCLTKSAARGFARQGDGEPYRVDVGENALVLCADDDGGYLLLLEPNCLSPQIIEQFKQDKKGTNHHDLRNC